MTPEDIVRALADSDEPIDGEYGYCTLCYGDELEDHLPTCPFRMAVKWVTEHPAS